MRTRTQLLAGALAALAFLSPPAVAVGPTDVVSEHLAQVSAVARRTSAQLDLMGGRVVLLLEQLDAMGAPDALIVRWGTAFQGRILDIAELASLQIQRISADAVHVLVRMGAEPGLIARFELAVADLDRVLRETAIEQVLCIERYLQALTT